MSTARVVVTQLRYDQKTFWRNSASVFFTVIQPIIFLFIFVSVFKNDTTLVGGHEIKRSTYYVPGIVTLGIVSATFFNLTVTLTRLRERGTLKRIRSAPLPPWVFIAGRIGTSITVAVLLVVLLVGIGWIVFGVSVPGDTLPGVALAVVVGATAFCCLSFAVTAAVPSEESAPPICNVIVLPLFFISGIFIPNEELPSAMRHVADVFPIKRLFNAMLTAFDPTTAAPGIAWHDLALVAAWGIAGLIVAMRAFRWTPRGD